jgi:hypothetical protein
VLLAAVLVLATYWPAGNQPAPSVSHVSAVATFAGPSPTYVSELGPAVVQPPQPSTVLPVAGAGDSTAGSRLAPAAAAAAATFGVALVFAGLRLRD